LNEHETKRPNGGRGEKIDKNIHKKNNTKFFSGIFVLFLLFSRALITSIDIYKSEKYIVTIIEKITERERETEREKFGGRVFFLIFFIFGGKERNERTNAHSQIENN
jgi:hypothetical protein